MLHTSFVLPTVWVKCRTQEIHIDKLLEASGMNLPSRLHGISPTALTGDQSPQRSLTQSVTEAIKNIGDMV